MDYLNNKVSEEIPILGRAAESDVEEMDIDAETWNKEYRDHRKILPVQRVKAPDNQTYLIKQSNDGLYNQPWWDQVTTTSRVINSNVILHEHWRWRGPPAELIEEINPKYSRRRFPKREYEMTNAQRIQRRVEVNHNPRGRNPEYDRPSRYGKRVRIQEGEAGPSNLNNNPWW